ncbi:hypothetical protein J6590_071198 [Homalodisca vitripennis]|nr:hypothetical protein J6590_071198 [Homalodisca vitripennis]
MSISHCPLQSRIQQISSNWVPGVTVESEPFTAKCRRLDNRHVIYSSTPSLSDLELRITQLFPVTQVFLFGINLRRCRWLLAKELDDAIKGFTEDGESVTRSWLVTPELLDTGILALGSRAGHSCPSRIAVVRYVTGFWPLFAGISTKSTFHNWLIAVKLIENRIMIHKNTRQLKKIVNQEVV